MIADAAALQYRHLARKQFLTGLGRDEFVSKYAETWAELNVVHSFREGNTRTQFVFFSQLAEYAGHRLDTEAFKIGAPLRDEFAGARFYSQATGDSSRLARVLDRALVSPAAEPVAAPVVDLADRRRRFPAAAPWSASGREDALIFNDQCGRSFDLLPETSRWHRSVRAVPLQLGGESACCFSLPSARRWGMVQGSLQDRLPGESLFETLRAQMPVADRRGPLGRLFGVHPIPLELRSWYVGAVGELAVARALSTLPDEWVVLHSVPVGERGSDIDHVLLAPTGRVITVNTKHHEGAAVWVASKALFVNGRRQPYLRNSRHEAERAERNLTAAVGFPVDVLAMIVLVGAKKLTIREEPDGIAVVRIEHMRSFLVRRVKPPRVPVDVAAVRGAASRPRTWSTRDLPDRDEALNTWFISLRRRVDVARQRRLSWAGGVLLAIVVALLSSGALGTAMHLL